MLGKLDHFTWQLDRRDILEILGGVADPLKQFAFGSICPALAPR